LNIYIDTSVVVSFFIQDDHADAARRWARTDPIVAISDWTTTEFSSALSHHVRLGSLSDRERKAAELAFDRWATGGVVLEVARDRFQDARILMQGHRRLRAPDALHLAIARHEGLPLATLDLDLRDAAVAEGLKVIDL
jgi:predicted nucleic acid-binding protein